MFIIYSSFKFEPTSLDPGNESDSTEVHQTVIARPADPTPPAPFDTVIVREKADGMATGLVGESA